MKYNIYHIIAGAAAIAAAALGGCAPVNSTTKAKRVPREYAINYNEPNVKADNSELNDKAWIVYSDRDENYTTIIPGGKLQKNDLGFMEPLIVIGRKKDYYKVVKYDDQVLIHENFKNKKKAEYYGWIHKNRLVLYNNSLTEIRNGLKLKSATAITDSISVFQSRYFLAGDSVKVFNHPALETEMPHKLGMHTIVYVLKTIENDTRALVAYKSSLVPETAGETVCGWIDTRMLVPIGQRLTLRNGTVEGVDSPFEFTPVLFPDIQDTTLFFRTITANPIIDPSDNRIFNVNGDPIGYNDRIEIEERLRRINVIYAFDLSEKVLDQMAMLTNSVQNMKAIFDASPDVFSISYGAAIGSNLIPVNSDYSEFSDAFMTICTDIRRSNTLSESQSLYGALQLAATDPGASNVIVYVGEKAGRSENPDRAIVDGFIRNNCRLVAFQIYAEEGDAYNNFVIQNTKLIERYGEEILTSKKAITIYTDQVRRRNEFIEQDKNIYRLDFPARSMTQGIVIFPEKKQLLTPDDLSAGVDTLMRDVEKDNMILMASLERAFNEVGSHRDRYDSGFAARYGIDPGVKIDQEFKSIFTSTRPQWARITPRIYLDNDERTVRSMSLLLTESELNDLKAFLERLGSRKVDIKNVERTKPNHKNRTVKRALRDLRGVPADAQLDYIFSMDDADSVTRVYYQTGSIRRHLYNQYMDELSNSMVTGKKKKMKNISLAKAQEQITTCPTLNPVMNNVTVKGVRRKRKLSDRQLELLILDYIRYRELVEAEIRPAEQFNTPLGEKYYLLPSEFLP